MDTRTLIVVAALCALPGCVTETTYAGQNSTQREVGPDLKAAAQTRLDLGIQYLQQGNAEQAKFNLDRALQYDPANPQVYVGFAYFYQQVEDFKAAEESYKKALAMDPSNADAMNQTMAPSFAIVVASTRRKRPSCRPSASLTTSRLPIPMKTRHFAPRKIAEMIKQASIIAWPWGIIPAIQGYCWTWRSFP